MLETSKTNLYYSCFIQREEIKKKEEPNEGRRIREKFNFRSTRENIDTRVEEKSEWWSEEKHRHYHPRAPANRYEGEKSTATSVMATISMRVVSRCGRRKRHKKYSLLLFVESSSSLIVSCVEHPLQVSINFCFFFTGSLCVGGG